MLSAFSIKKENDMDHIDLKGMAFFGYHGDEPEETKLGQRFYIDVEMDLDLSKVGKSDALEDSVNYVAVYEMVKKRAEGGPYKLLERLAGVINEDIMEGFPLVMKVITTVHKPGSPIPGILEDVSVTLSAERK
jgi:dihydroneopterin aldolase